ASTHFFSFAFWMISLALEEGSLSRFAIAQIPAPRPKAVRNPVRPEGAADRTAWAAAWATSDPSKVASPVPIPTRARPKAPLEPAGGFPPGRYSFNWVGRRRVNASRTRGSVWF